MSIARWTRHLGLAAVAALATTACAGTGDPVMDGMDPEQSYVVVDNTNTTISSATIFLYPDTGVRQMLGTVTMNEQKAFEVERDVNTQFRLVAEAGVDELSSRTFTLTQGDVVEWDLNLNTINYRGGQDR